MNVNEVLNTISCLSEEEQFFITDLLNKRMRELKRSQIAARGKQAEENYKQGHITSGTVADLMSAVDTDD